MPDSTFQPQSKTECVSQSRQSFFLSAVNCALSGIALFCAPVTTIAQAGHFTVQVGSLRTQAAAVALVERMNTAGAGAYFLKVAIPGKGTFYRVRAGQFALTTQAREQGEKLQRAGLVKGFFVAKYEAPGKADSGSAPTGASTRPRRVSRGQAAASGFEEEKTPARGIQETRWDAIAPPWRSSSASPANRPPQGSSRSEGSWELFFAGGGSLWTHKDATLNLNELVGAGLPSFRVRQSFATGARLALGVVKSLNDRSAFELSYGYGTNNFRITALEDGQKIRIPEIKPGDSLSLGVRSHWLGYNYRHTLFTGEMSRVYLTAGGNLAVFAPNEEARDVSLVVSGGNLGGF